MAVAAPLLFRPSRACLFSHETLTTRKTPVGLPCIVLQLPKGRLPSQHILLGLNHGSSLPAYHLPLLPLVGPFPLPPSLPHLINASVYSAASVFTSITSTAHALSLGNIYTTPAQIRDAQQELDDLPKGPAVSPRISDRGDAVGEKRKREGGIDEDWEEDPVGGNAQPWVGIMGRR